MTTDLNPREAALKKINDALTDAKAAADARVRELEAELARAPRNRFGRRAPDPRVADLEAENAALRARIAELERVPEPEPEPEIAEPVAFEGRPTLPQLESLTAQARGPRSEEWAAYISVLREHASADGTIPPQFDDILRDVFGLSF